MANIDSMTSCQETNEPPAEGSRALSVDQLSMRLHGFSALEDVTFTISPQTATAIVGPNGAGKTTLLNCVTGVYRPSAGSISFGGRRISGLRPYKVAGLGVARTFQGIEQFRDLRVCDLVLIGRQHHYGHRLIEASLGLGRYRKDEAEQRRLAFNVCQRFGIERFFSMELETTPYAVRKLADLARAIASDPELLLLDEPSAGMASSEKASLRDHLLEIKAAHNRTIIIVDHDIEFLSQICDDAVVLDFGRRIASGAMSSVLRDERVMEAYLGVRAHEGDTDLTLMGNDEPLHGPSREIEGSP